MRRVVVGNTHWTRIIRNSESELTEKFIKLFPTFLPTHFKSSGPFRTPTPKTDWLQENCPSPGLRRSILIFWLVHFALTLWLSSSFVTKIGNSSKSKNWRNITNHDLIKDGFPWDLRGVRCLDGWSWIDLHFLIELILILILEEWAMGIVLEAGLV